MGLCYTKLARVSIYIMLKHEINAGDEVTLTERVATLAMNSLCNAAEG